MNVTELRPGNYFIDEGNLYQVMDILLNKTAMRKMVAKIKAKNMRTGAITELARNSGYDVEKAVLSKKKMAYLYNSGSGYVFMDNETYEQTEITEDKLAEEKKFLKENMEVQIDFYQGEIIGITLPEKVEYIVAETTEAVKGNTTNNAQKDATLENGYVVKVPLFITQGEKIIVSTLDGKYSSRA